MKARRPSARLTAVLMAALLLLLPAGGRTEDLPETAPAEPLAPQADSVPRLELAETAFDFGTIHQDQEASHVFRFRNAGTAELVIEPPRTSCGCTAALLAAGKIPPGGEGEIKVTFTSGSMEGRKTKTITVLSNDPELPEAVLTISGTIAVAVKAEPPFWFANDLRKGTSFSREILVLPGQGESFELTGVETSSPFIKASAAPLQDRPGYTLKITAKSGLPIGTLNESVTVRTSNPHRPVVVIPVRGRVKGAITVDPGSCYFRVLDDSDRPNQSLIIEKAEGHLRILSVKSEDPAVRATISVLEPQRRFQLLVELTDPVPDVGLRSRVILTTDDHEQPQLVVPVIVHRRPAGAATATPAGPAGTPAADPASTPAGQAVEAAP